MPTDFSIKINRRDGALEISGPERDWVDAKLAELSDVYTGPLPDVSEGDANSDAKRSTTKHRPKRANKPKTTENADGKGDAPANQKRARRSGGRPQRNPELEVKLTRDLLHKFNEFIEERRAAWDKKQTHQTAIIATFLEDEIGWPAIDEDDLYTVYRALSLDGPTNYRSTLQNAYGRDKFFTGITDGKYTLSISGEKFGRSGSVSA